MQLAATDDVVFFPSLLTLEKGEERFVRVGTAVPAARVERSYRLFIEELPPAERPGEPGVVRVLTKTSIPVFIQPSKAQPVAVLEGLAVTGGRFSFVLRNAGTAHVPPLALKVAASGAPGQLVLEREINVWYLLPGGIRTLDLDLPRPGCSQVRELQVSVEIDGTTTIERLPTPSGACGLK